MDENDAVIAELEPPKPEKVDDPETRARERDRLRRLAGQLTILREIKRHGVYWPGGMRRRSRFS